MSLQRRWAIAFATMSVLVLVSAATSLVAMTQLVDRFRAAAVHVDRETATATRLRSAIEEELNVAHGVVDGRPGSGPVLTRLDRALAAQLAAAPRAYGGAPERALIRRLEAQWRAGLRVPRRLAAAPRGAPRPADRARDIRIHETLNGRLAEMRATFAGLETQIRLSHRGRLAAGGASRDRLLVVLLAAALVSIVALVVFGRRMAREVLAPIRELREAWLQLGARETARRVTPRRDDELGELARTFNAMADALEAGRTELARQAKRDALTGLPNRHALADVAPAGGTVIFVDLDDFKAVNDGLGHHAGDELLCEVARRLRACVRATDVPVRLGGDEFAILLPGLDVAGAERLAERILLELSLPFEVGGAEAHVGASIGIAGAGGSLDEALRHADAAMYAAKKHGKQRWVAFDPAVH
jgi:diguanylate cyclase (GGDEF)-like protein